jgi:hypothetical protein
MAKKSKKNMFSAIKEGISYVSDTVFSTLFTRVNEEADVLMDKAEHRAYRVEERLIGKLGISLLMGLGVLSLIIAGIFYLIEYVRVSKPLVFLVVGILLLLIGMFLKIQDMRRDE